MGVAVDVRSIAISVSVCLSVCRHFSITTCPKFAKFSVHVTCGRSLVLLWQQCSTLYTSVFLYMASCFHVMEQMGQNQRRRVCFIQFARWWHQLDIKQRCLVEFTSWQHRGWSLLSPAAHCCQCRWCCVACRWHNWQASQTRSMPRHTFMWTSTTLSSMFLLLTRPTTPYRTSRLNWLP